MDDVVIEIENLKKMYRLGTIGGGTLTADLQSWWARLNKKEDPNSKIGENRQAGNKDYFYALDGINLTVHKGETLGIIGTNGAGKSTLLKLLSRVTAPTEGTIKMNGRIASMLEVGTGFHRELTGRENIYMNGAILGMTKSEIDSKIEEIIEFSECRRFIDTPVKRYSSGMYVKLAFAVAAHLDAEIMVMDEVLAVGDMKFQKKCLGKMGNSATHDGKTVLYVSHNMNTIRELCSRCIVLEQGRIIFDGDVESAIEKYMGISNADYPAYYDLSNAPRPTLDHGRDVFLNYFKFENKDKAVYESKEKMVCSFNYTSKVSDRKIGIYTAIITADENIIGTAFSKILDTTSEGESKTVTVELDISNLIEGSYYFYLDVFYTDGYGGYESCDHPWKKIFFEVVNDNYIVRWNKRDFGSIRLSNWVVH